MPADDAPYIDTSALAKWYLPESRSDEVEAFLREQRLLAISRLTLVEFRSMVARRRRARELDPRMEERVVARFEENIRDGCLIVHPLEDSHAVTACEIMSHLARHPLRTLDALHLAIARGIRAKSLVTADRVMAEAAKSLGFAVQRFD